MFKHCDLFDFEASEKEIPDTPPDDPTKVNEWEQLVAKKKVRGLLLEGETNQTESACLYFTMLKLGPKDAYSDSRQNYGVIKVIDCF